MDNKISILSSRLFKGRFEVLKGLFAIFLVASFIVRLLLLVYSFKNVSLSIIDILKSFGVGLFFDIITLSYFQLPFLIFILIIPANWASTKLYKSLVWFFYSLAIFIVVFNSVAEFFFWDEFEVRFNFIAVDYLVYTTEVIGNIVESYPIGWLVFVELLIVASLIRLTIYKGWINRSLSSGQEFMSRIKQSLPFISLTVFAMLFVNLRWSSVTSNHYNNELSKNGLYSIFEAYKNNELDYDHFYLTISDKEAFGTVRTCMQDSAISFVSEDVLNPVYHVAAKGDETKMNVILVCVESLSGEYLDYIKEPDSFETPFLDSLANQSLFFTNMYANGTRTVRGLEAINLSIPPTPGTSIVRRPNNDNLFSLGTIFKNKGYQNKFLYGGYGYFDNMNDFFSGIGYEIIDHSSLTDPEISFENAWGACDGDIYNKTIKEADKSYAAGKPFLNFIMTTSNHRPYTFPNVGFPITHNREGGVKYTDYALGQFFKAIKNKPWFNNTLFVVVADHCGSSAGKSELPVLKYQIPCMIYNKHLLQPKKIDKLCDQIDVAPTIMALMNWNYNSVLIGRDILKMKPIEERAFIGTYEKLGYLRNNQLLILSPQKKVEQFSFDRITGEEKKTGIDPKLKRELIAYYQVSEHMFINGWSKFSK